jgi:hypothetical protein
MKHLLKILLIAVVITGCDALQFDDDINISPNSPSQASGPQLTANAMLYLSQLSGSTQGLQGQFSAQYLSETQYVVASLYPEGGTSFYPIYQGPLVNLETVINSSTSNNQLAVAKILKAFYFWHMTDRWGDVPYSEALKGAENFTPAYDTQAQIYDNLFALLKEATANMDNSAVTSDILYSGNMERWRKLANTMRMLMALRLSEVDANRARAEFTDALNAGVMSSNADNLVFRHLADANNMSYWHSQVEVSRREWWALSSTLVDLMKPVNDPRLPVYGDPARNGGEYNGLPIGTAPAGNNTEDYSLLGSYARQQDAAFHFVTYAQVLFAKAEAASRGWISESAETNYNAAVTASIAQWTGSDATAAAYLAQAGVTFNSGSAIEQIATQRYIHLFLNGYEGWAEYRRTGYPAMAQSAGAAVPTRQSYATTESFNNTENYNAAVQRQFGGNDSQYAKVWWDAN